MAWIWAVISVITFLYLLQELLTLNKNKKLPPGPKALPIIGHFHLLGKNPHHDLHHLAKKYGPIIYLRFGFVHTIVISSPAAAELVLKTRDLVFAGRPYHQAAKHLSYDQKNIVFSPYGTYWRNMRKLCTLELLSNLKINQFRPMRRTEIACLVSCLKQAAEQRETVDMSARVLALSGDMTCLMVFGRKFVDGDLDEKGFKAVIEEALEVAALPNLGDYFPFMGVLDLQGLTRRMKELSKIFDGFLERIIDDHARKREEKKEDQDFVDTMMRIMVLDLLIGGMDTSAAAIEWALSELIRHPKVMQKLQKELEQVVGMDQTVEEPHLDKLNYLNLVIKETLRVHPVVPLLIHETIEDCTIDRFHISKGSRVIVNVWSIGKDPKVWQDPEKFEPERFVGSNIDLRGQDFELIPFGSGRRGCPGMQLGLTVVRLVVAQLVHCFDWDLPNEMVANDLDMGEHFGLVTGREKHLMAIPTYRLSK
ncbi:Cytochrome P450 CYP2 subfamily [Handroanthus impetiginosus]|uniref:Cytochrome P450 CYP2 subfamily n=1 Tax=Handroanthus impetiginosus TaxID=429701 RepID=A0A2G9H8E6_9LAMI|nr:Cytochrome P450 CYP2 subfamily [Handroanthus impetiginosus]